MPRKKTPKLCHCGCGEWTSGGDFKPGHDSKTLSAILECVGGVIELKRIVEQVTNEPIVVKQD